MKRNMKWKFRAGDHVLIKGELGSFIGIVIGRIPYIPEKVYKVHLVEDTIFNSDSHISSCSEIFLEAIHLVSRDVKIKL